MIEKFAGVRRVFLSEFIDLNHTRVISLANVLQIAKFVPTLPHAKTNFAIRTLADWNRDQRYQGQRDIPLNATGRGQAARNGKVLAGGLGERAADLDYVASPLERACETMQIVRRELGLAPDAFRTDDRLKEVHYGHWEGQLLDELATSDPEGFAARGLDAWGWQPRGGESYAAMSQRVALWLRDVSRDAVVVAHGGVSRALRGLVLRDMPRAEVPALPVPQDKILVLAGGLVSWL